MERVFVDTSAWFAYMNRADPDHHRVRSTIDALKGALVTSDYVFDELVTLALVRSGHAVAVAVGKVLLDPAQVSMERVTPADHASAWTLFQQRPDKDYSFTDCTSFAIMRRLGVEKAVTTDLHFRQEGFVTVP